MLNLELYQQNEERVQYWLKEEKGKKRNNLL